MPRITVAPHTPALAADFNAVSDQSIMTFGTAAQRSAAIPTPTDGMHTYRTDADALEYWNGTAWVGVLPSDAARCYFRGIRAANFNYTVQGWNIFIDTEQTDAAGAFDPAGGGIFTAPRAGRVDFRGRSNVSFTGAAPGPVTVLACVRFSTDNGSTYGEAVRGTALAIPAAQASLNAEYASVVAGSAQVSAGWKLRLEMYVTGAGATMTCNGGSASAYFEGWYA